MSFVLLACLSCFQGISISEMVTASVGNGSDMITGAWTASNFSSDHGVVLTHSGSVSSSNISLSTAASEASQTLFDSKVGPISTNVAVELMGNTIVARVSGIAATTLRSTQTDFLEISRTETHINIRSTTVQEDMTVKTTSAKNKRSTAIEGWVDMSNFTAELSLMGNGSVSSLSPQSTTEFLDFPSQSSTISTSSTRPNSTFSRPVATTVGIGTDGSNSRLTHFTTPAKKHSSANVLQIATSSKTSHDIFTLKGRQIFTSIIHLRQGSQAILHICVQHCQV